MRSVDTLSDFRTLRPESNDNGGHVLLIIYAGLGLLGMAVVASITAFLTAGAVYLAIGSCLAVAAVILVAAWLTRSFSRSLGLTVPRS